MAVRKAVGKVWVRVAPDTAGFSAQLKADLKKIRERNPLEIKVQADLTKIEAQIRAFTARKRDVTVQVNLQTGAAAAQLAALARTRTATIRTKVDESGLNRIKQVFGTLGSGTAGTLGGISSILGTVSSSFGRATVATAKWWAIIQTTITSVGGLVAAVGTMSGALLVLPGLALAGASAIGVLAIAFSNFKDAGGAAAEVRQAFIDMKDQALNLRSVVQDNFFAPLIDPIRKLGANYLPLLTDKLGGLARVMGRGAAAFVGFLNLPQTMQDTATGLENTTGFMDGLVRATEPLLQVFRDISVVGSSFLPGFGNSLDTLSHKFADFIAKARDDGSIARWIQNGIDGLKSFGRSLSNIGSAFGGLFDAANVSGANFLANLETTTQKLSDFLNNPQVKAGLGDFFAGGREALDIVATALGQTLPRLLETLGPSFRSLATSVAGVFASIITAIGPILEKIGPPFAALVKTIGGAFSSALSKAGPGLSALADAVVALAPVLGTAAQTLFPLLAQVINDLAPVIAPLAQQILPLIVSAFETLIPAIAPLVSTLLPPLVQVFQTLLPPLVQLVQAILPPLIQLFQDMAPVILAIAVAVAPVITKIGEILIPLIESLLPIVERIFPALIPVIQTAMLIIADILSIISAVINGDWEKFWEGIKSFAGHIWDLIKDLLALAWENIKALAKIAWEWIKDTIVAALQGVWDWITGIFWNIVDWIDSNIWQPIKSAAETAWNWVKDHIIQPLEAAWAWIIGTLASWGSWIDTHIWQPIVSVAETVWNWVKEHIIEPLQEAWDWVTDQFSGIVDSIQSIWDRVKAALVPIDTSITVTSSGIQAPLFGVGPPAARGAVVDPTPGGSQWTVGEAGQQEIVTPTPLLRQLQRESEQRLLSQLGGGTNNYPPITLNHYGPGELAPEAVVNALEEWKRLHP